MQYCKCSEIVGVKGKSDQNGWKRVRESRVETARVGAAEVVKCVPHVRKKIKNKVRGFSSQWADEWLERGMEKKE